MTPEQQNALSALVRVYPSWRKARGLQPQSCVLAVRLATDVLAYWGVDVEPVPVAVQVQNARMVELLEAGVAHDQAALESMEGFAVGTDPNTSALDPRVRRPKGAAWNCHLIAWLPKESTVVDLSLEQYHRPLYRIHVGAAAALVPPDSAAGFFERGEWLTHVSSSGTRVMYRHHPDQTAFRDAPDWSRDALRRRLAGDLIKIIRDDHRARTPA